jgi:hypothetical protein
MKNLFLILTSFLATSSASSQSNADITTFPIELRYFNAQKQATNSTVLSWLAPCQTSDATFEIQSSIDSKNFTTINTITANQERCYQPFQFTDTRALGSKTFYRIRLITPSNLSIHSYIIPVISKESGFELNSLWPSQVLNTAVLNFSSGNDEQVSFHITDLNGRKLKSISQQVKSGNNQVVLDFSQFSFGQYFIQAVTSRNEQRVLRFQKL